MLEQLSDIAIERFYGPRNYGELENADSYAKITGPCGDTMQFWIQISEEKIRGIGFNTDGCGFTLAAGSMATELAEGKTLLEASCIEQKDILDALGGLPEAGRHCALLASNTLKEAIKNYHKKTEEEK